MTRLADVIASNYLNDGEVTELFEQTIANFCGSRHAIAVTSGTTAIYLSLLALDVGVNDEVIVPDITFIATANAVTMTGATVVLVDVDSETLCMQPEALRRAISKKTRAIVPVHVSGRAGSLSSILQVANDHGIFVVEDACEALGSQYGGAYLGAHGICGCFSLSPFKIISSGQGGLIITDSDRIANRLEELKDQGRPLRGTGSDDRHPSLGFNFKYTNLQAAVALAQFEQIESRLRKQAYINKYYKDRLRGLQDFHLFPFDVNQGEVPLWSDAKTSDRDSLVAYLRTRHIDCRNFWHPLHTQAPYQANSTSFPVSTRLAYQSLWLPSAYQLTDAQLNYVCDTIKEFYVGV